MSSEGSAETASTPTLEDVLAILSQIIQPKSRVEAKYHQNVVRDVLRGLDSVPTSSIWGVLEKRNLAHNVDPNVFSLLLAVFPFFVKAGALSDEAMSLGNVLLSILHNISLRVPASPIDPLKILNTKHSRALYSAIVQDSAVFAGLAQALAQGKDRDNFLSMVALAHLCHCTKIHPSTSALLSPSAVPLLQSAAAVAGSGRLGVTAALWECMTPLFRASVELPELSSVFVTALSRGFKRGPEFAVLALAPLLSALPGPAIPAVLAQIQDSLISTVKMENADARNGALRSISAIAVATDIPAKVVTDLIPALLGSIKGVTGPWAERVGVFSAVARLASCPNAEVAKSADAVFKALQVPVKSDGNDQSRQAAVLCLCQWSARTGSAPEYFTKELTAAIKSDKDVERKGALEGLSAAIAISPSPFVFAKIAELSEAIVALIKGSETKAVLRTEALYAIRLLVASGLENKLKDGKLWSSLIAGESQHIFSFESGVLSKSSSPRDFIVAVDAICGILGKLTDQVDAAKDTALFRTSIALLVHSDLSIRSHAFAQYSALVSSVPEMSVHLLASFSSHLCSLPVVSDANRSSILCRAFLSIAAPLSYLQQQPDASLLSTILLLAHHPALANSDSMKTWGVWRSYSAQQRSASKPQQEEVAAAVAESDEAVAVPSASSSSSIKDILSTHLSAVVSFLFSENAMMHKDSRFSRAAIHAMSTLTTACTPSQVFSTALPHFTEALRTSTLLGFSSQELAIYAAPEGTLVSAIDPADLDVRVEVEIKKEKKSKAQAMYSDKQWEAEMRKEAEEKAKKKTEELRAQRLKEITETLLVKESATRQRVATVVRKAILALETIAFLCNDSRTRASVLPEMPSLVPLVFPILSISPSVASRVTPLFAVAASTARSMVKIAPAPLARFFGIVSNATVRLLGGDNDTTRVDMVDDDAVLAEELVRNLRLCCIQSRLPSPSFALVFPVLEHILLHKDRNGAAGILYTQSTLQLTLSILEMHAPHDDTPSKPAIARAFFFVLSHFPALYRHAASALHGMAPHLVITDLQPFWDALLSPHHHMRAAAIYVFLHYKYIAEVPEDYTDFFSSHLWFAQYDSHAENAALAAKVWTKSRLTLTASYSDELVPLLSHEEDVVRQMAAAAIASAISVHPSSIQETITKLFNLYNENVVEATPEQEQHEYERITAADEHLWPSRLGVAYAFAALANFLAARELPVLFTFLISKALSDRNDSVRSSMVKAGQDIINLQGKENLGILLPIFETFLQKSRTDANDAVASGVVVFMGAIARHLEPEDPKVQDVAERLLKALRTPSEDVQRAVCECLVPLVRTMNETTLARVHRVVTETLTAGANYGERRGGAYGLTAFIQGLGIGSIKKYEMMKLITTLAEAKGEKSREAAMLAIELCCGRLGRMFEPYTMVVLPCLLSGFSDSSSTVRQAASDTARVVMANLGPYGVRIIVPVLMNGLNDRAWRTKQGCVELLGSMAYCAPRQLSTCLPNVVPKLVDALVDTHAKVNEAAKQALERVGGVVGNPEIAQHVTIVLKALMEPGKFTEDALDALLYTRYIHSVDAPSLALVVPVLYRALRERTTAWKIKAAQIVGSMTSLVTDPKDMAPYVPQLLPQLQGLLADPIPEVRTMSSKAIGSILKGLGEDKFPQLIPWMLATMRSEASTVERAGAAQGLAEVIHSIGIHRLTDLEGEIIRGTMDSKAHVREGYMYAFAFLPQVLGDLLQPFLPRILPCVLRGLADEGEGVRSVSLAAGSSIVDRYAVSSLPLLQPALEEGLFSDAWRIRFASVLLLGNLLSRVISSTTGRDPLASLKATEPVEVPTFAEDEDEDNWEDGLMRENVNRSKPMAPAPLVDEPAEDEKKAKKGKEQEGPIKKKDKEAVGYGKGKEATVVFEERIEDMSSDLDALTNVLGKERCHTILASIYMMRSDTQLAVRQEAAQVWSRLVVNTPRTLRLVLPSLTTLLVRNLASRSLERRVAAGRALGDLVKKLGDRLMPELIPILAKGLDALDADTRQGVCVGLTEIVNSTGKLHIMAHMGSLLPVIKRGLCDKDNSVRESAGGVFDELYRSVGMRAINEIVPSLIDQLESSNTAESANALAALRQLIIVRPNNVLPFLIPILIEPPITESHARAIAAVAEVAGPALQEHFDELLPVLIAGLSMADNAGVRQASSSIVSTLDADGVSPLITEIEKGLISNLPEIRTGSVQLAGIFCSQSSSIEMRPQQVQSLLTSLVRMLNDRSDDVQVLSLAALDSLVKGIKKEELPNYIAVVRDTIKTMTEDDRGRKMVDTLPALCKPKGLGPLLPMFLQGLLFGFAEVRQHAALGLGEMIQLTTVDCLKPFVIQITGPLIRIVGDRFPPQVKAAILSTLSLLLSKGGVSLKPFLPQLQTTFIKSLNDPDKSVRGHAAEALGKVVALGGRVESVITELLTALKAGGDNTESLLVAVANVVLLAAERTPAASLAPLVPAILAFLFNNDERVRKAAAQALGVVTKFIDLAAFDLILDDDVLVEGDSFERRHGRVMAVSSIIQHSWTRLPERQMDILGFVVKRLSDEIANIREAALEPFKSLLPELDEIPVAAAQAIVRGVNALANDAGNSLRQQACMTIKYWAKSNPQQARQYVGTLAPTLIDRTRDRYPPVKSAAERGLVYLFSMIEPSYTAALEEYLSSLDSRTALSYGDYVKKVVNKSVSEHGESEDEDEE